MINIKKIIISDFSNNLEDILTRLNKDSIIITSSNNTLEYKKIISKKNIKFDVLVSDLRTFIYNIYQTHINKLPILTNAEKKLMFLKAINNISNELNYLSDFTIDIINDLIKIYDNEIDYKLIKNKYSNKLTSDISNIIVEYEMLINNKYIDEQQLYLEVSAYLSSFQDSLDIYITNIDSLNEVEKDIIISLVSNYSYGYIYFNKDILIPGNEVEYEEFISINDKLSPSVEIEHLNNSLTKEKNYLINNLYKLDHSKTDELSLNLELYGANDLYDEVLFVTNQIRKNIRTNNKRYSDFVIVSNCIDDYENYFELLFNIANIPYNKINKINRNFLNYIITMMDIMNNGINGTNLKELINLKYYKINDYQLNNILDNIKNKNISSLEQIQNLIDVKLYTYLESIIYPLINIKKDLSVSEYLIFIYNYLDEFQIINKINNICTDSWNEFVKIIDSINIVFGEDKLYLNYVSDILSHFLKSISIKNNYVDEVQIGIPNIINKTTNKIIFFIGMNEGIVPIKISDNLLMNRYLVKKYYMNYPGFKDTLIDKQSTFKAITSSLEMTYLVYHKVSLSGSPTNKAPIIDKVKSIYPNIKNYTNEELSEFVNVNSVLFTNYLINDNKDYVKKLTKYYKSNGIYDEYFDKINNFDSFYKPNNLNNELLNEIHEVLNLSPSSIDMYNHCHFRYYCKYMLKLKEEDNSLYDNRLVGNYIHFLLEKLVSTGATKDNIKGLLSFYKKEFIINNELVIDEIINYLIDNLNNNVEFLWPIIYDEINTNCFKPKFLELNISNDKEIKPLVLNSNDTLVYLRGIIDRVDFSDNYFRIIDYKTGNKKFDFSDVANGLNLQLLIYLLSIKNWNKDLIPAGIFYMPSYIKYQSTDDKEYRLTGIFNNNEEVLEKLGGEFINEYIDAHSRGKIKKDVVFTGVQIEELLTHVEKEVLKTAGGILDGVISINPYRTVNHCTYCKYKSICGIENGSTNYRKYKKYKYDEAWEVIRGDEVEVD